MSPRKVNPKIKLEHEKPPEKPPPGIRVLNLPVSPSRREACASILDGVVSRIDNALQAHKKQLKATEERKRKAAQPWERLKRKLVTREARLESKVRKRFGGG